MVRVLAFLLFFPLALLAGEGVEYRLGSGDRVRITVFDEPDLSGEFEVGGTGSIAMPLIGEVRVGGVSIREGEARIVEKLKDGFLKAPRVSIDVLNYRPFYILGEVNNPGSYPYANGISVLNAVALGGGFTYRADEKDITITREGAGGKEKVKVKPDDPVLPGDMIRVEERFF